MCRRATAACLGLALLGTTPTSAAIIRVTPADGSTAYKKIEAAVAGDEVIVAPGTYAFRVYLQDEGTAQAPVHIHSDDPANQAVWAVPAGQYIEDLPGSYSAPDKNRGLWQINGAGHFVIEGLAWLNATSQKKSGSGIRYAGGCTVVLRHCLFQDSDSGLVGGREDSNMTAEFSEFSRNGVKVSPPAHNLYIFAGIFTMRYSYIHDSRFGRASHDGLCQLSMPKINGVCLKGPCHPQRTCIAGRASA
jgi:hypothetical protein